MEKKWMRPLKWLALPAVCGGIFAAAFRLYHLPVAAALYPSVLCALLLLAVLAACIWKKRQKLKKLAALASLPDDLPERLEEFDGEADDAYREIILGLLRRSEELQRQTQRREEEQRDYYTTWVHQIKTPIASMRLLLESEDSAFSRTLGEELQRIEQYAEMVLTYQRLDSVDTDYLFRECRVDKIVKSAIRKFAAQFIRKGIRLEYTPIDACVVTDEKWLAFVVEQLLSNALKYTPRGTVTIYWENECLCIRDTGIGIAPEDLPRIFDRGYTGDTGRSDKKATGLGLYLCRRICKNLGHGISAESTPGKGTLIRLDLSRRETVFE